MDSQLTSDCIPVSTTEIVFDDIFDLNHQLQLSEFDVFDLLSIPEPELDFTFNMNPDGDSDSEHDSVPNLLTKVEMTSDEHPWTPLRVRKRKQELVSRLLEVRESRRKCFMYQKDPDLAKDTKESRRIKKAQHSKMYRDRKKLEMKELKLKELQELEEQKKMPFKKRQQGLEDFSKPYEK